MTRDYILEGFDPTTIPPGSCLTLSQLLQMVHAAQPVADIGFLIVSATPPDVATYPVLARFLWIDATGSLYWYNGASWSLVATTVSIAPGTVLPSMLGVDTGLPYQVLAVSASGLSVTFQDIRALIGACGVTTMAGFGTQKLLTIDGATLKLCGVDPSAFLASSVAWTKVASPVGTAGQYPLRDGAGGWSWATPGVFSIPDYSIVITKLSAAGGGANQVMAVDGATGHFKWYTIPTYPTFVPTWNSGVVSVPTHGDAVGNPITLAHGLGAMPNYARAVLVRTAAASIYGYNQNDEIDINALQASSNEVAFTLSYDATYVYLLRSDDAVIRIRDRTPGTGMGATTGDRNDIATITDWGLKIYAARYY